ncbi:adenosylmethionine-8-amino-7-oxononanoate aminotransferase [Bradyrhizobium sp. i1.15.2]|uniref:hypothetical protein n=1 Tax=Bradyrhizobium sp. i1.15.2 TaxID=3156362 RepID=UPI003398020C
MIGIEFVADRATRRPFAPDSNSHRLVAKLAAQRGVLTRALPYIDVNSFSPPLSISRSDIEEGVARYATALKDALPVLNRLAA